MDIVVCRGCRLGCRRICHHSPHPDRLFFSLSSLFVVLDVLVIFLFVSIPPPPDCFIPQFLDRIAPLLGIIDYKELTLKQTFHIALLVGNFYVNFAHFYYPKLPEIWSINITLNSQFG